MVGCRMTSAACEYWRFKLETERLRRAEKDVEVLKFTQSAKKSSTASPPATALSTPEEEIKDQIAFTLACMIALCAKLHLRDSPTNCSKAFKVPVDVDYAHKIFGKINKSDCRRIVLSRSSLPGQLGLEEPPKWRAKTFQCNVRRPK